MASSIDTHSSSLDKSSFRILLPLDTRKTMGIFVRFGYAVLQNTSSKALSYLHAVIRVLWFFEDLPNPDVGPMKIAVIDSKHD
jgi:hypothetical protein